MADNNIHLPGQVYNSPKNVNPYVNKIVKPNVNIRLRPRTNPHDDPLLKSDNENSNVINEERKKFFVKCREGNLEEVKKYIGLYPDFIDDIDDNDRPCILMGVLSGNSALFEYLIRKGADIKTITKDHNNLLHAAAAFGGNLEIFRFLVDDKGLDINKQNLNSSTPLHYAVVWVKKDIVEFLINKGANLYLKDKAGYIPYDYTYKGRRAPGEGLFKGMDSSKKESLINDLKSIEKMLKDAMDKSPPQGGSRKFRSRRQRKRKSRTRKTRR